MPNTFANTQELANDTLDHFLNQLTFLKNVDREYEDKFGREGAKIGDTLRLRDPVRFEVSEGAQITSFEDVIENTRNLVIEKRFKVPFAMETFELSMNVDMIRERYIAPATAALANEVECYFLEKAYQGVHNCVGVPGTTPTTLKTYSQALAKLRKFSCPNDRKACVALSTDMNVEVVDALKGLLQPGPAIGKQFLTGLMGHAMGATWYENQNLRVHRVGPLGGTPAVNGASQTGASLVTNGWTSAAANRIKKGDTFTIGSAGAGTAIYSLNPVSGDRHGDLAEFTVTADGDSDGSGNLTIGISPSIIVTGAYKNVTASPASGALLNFRGAANTYSPQGLAWHPAAFSFAAPPLMDPSAFGCWGARSTSKNNGISIRIVRQYDITYDRVITRLDVICGFVVKNPYWACRIASGS